MIPVVDQGLIAFAVSLVLVLVCRSVARRYELVATPRADRWHGRPTALLGGVAIAVTVLGLHVLLIGFTALPILLIGTTAIFVVGLVDDLVSLSPATKLVFQIAIAAFFTFFGYRLAWSTSLTLDTLVTILWIVGLTNAFNLVDNMDGLCAGLCLVAGTGLAATLGGSGDAAAMHLALLIGATAGFLVFNFPPASIFMGDSGSLFIGVNLAVLTLNGRPDNTGPASLLSTMTAPALILLVPIVDTLLVTVSRLLSGRSAAEGGRDHSSHRLVAIGLSERSAVTVLWVVSALGGASAVALARYANDLSGLAAALLVIAVVIFAVYLAQVRVYSGDEPELAASERITPLVVNFMYRRRIAEVLLDLCLVAIAYYSAYRLRFDAESFPRYFPLFLASLPLVLGVQILSLFAMGGYRGVWRYFGLMDGVTYAKAVALGTVANIALLVYAYRFEQYSRGVFVIYAALLMLLVSGSRASFRLISEFVHRRGQRGIRVVIYGAGDVAASAVRDILMRRYGTYRMCGFILDDPTMERARMQGYPVLGNYETLLRQVDEGRVDMVVITQLIDVQRLEELRVRCSERSVSLERLHFELAQLVAAS